MTRKEIADKILARLEPMKAELAKEFAKPGRVNTFYVDDLLDEASAKKIYEAFPDKSEMMEKKSLREYKNVAAQMNKYNPLLEEAVYAFQDPRLIALVSEITGLREAIPDDRLYAGGISLMSQGNFLNPHLDNSHDNAREHYRILNLLYYVTPNWEESFGGNLELWDNGVDKPQRTIFSKFNRLAVMITNKSSFHSVSKVVVDGNRCCVSNYYFSSIPAEREHYFHVTSFYGRPEEKFKDFILRIDSSLRNLVRKVFKKGVVKTKHIYDKNVK
ncbi:2OG-Fe(II) oxygenase [Pseudochryseolinea flava]|uniref:2OG-Fe(II) oxygenase n=1 Tax=Pseudochryseolinea flava TaxID=2059302 RepID=A0A364XUJ4_9BACT|nr:2OG-Fe(II) oxygenase [Pseudochryseolinea flava]RAV97792.1 2OG-Fe(II) oxygenase [Pseudochryseolinea flava]